MYQPFYRHRRDVHSQNGEDGVISEILHLLGVTGGWVVESGAWDGVHLSNTFALVEDDALDFRALYIEGDSTKYNDLVATAQRFPNKIVPVNSMLERDDDTLGKLMRQHDLPADVAVLSIDIDSWDYDVWKNLDQSWRPMVVIIEIDSSVYPTDWRIFGRNSVTGTSFLPTLLLGAEKGYRLVAHTGNMIFVRSDLWPKLGIPDTDNPMMYFHPAWLPA